MMGMMMRTENLRSNGFLSGSHGLVRKSWERRVCRTPTVYDIYLLEIERTSHVDMIGWWMDIGGRQH